MCLSGYLFPYVIYIAVRSLSAGSVLPTVSLADDYSYTHEHSDREEHDSSGAYEDDVGHSDYDSGDHYDSGSGGAGSASYDGYSSSSS